MDTNFRLRSGDAHTANNFKAFPEETLSFFKEKVGQDESGRLIFGIPKQGD
jgi:hypothetical protein